MYRSLGRQPPDTVAYNYGPVITLGIRQTPGSWDGCNVCLAEPRRQSLPARYTAATAYRASSLRAPNPSIG